MIGQVVSHNTPVARQHIGGSFLLLSIADRSWLNSELTWVLSSQQQELFLFCEMLLCFLLCYVKCCVSVLLNGGVFSNLSVCFL